MNNTSIDNARPASAADAIALLFADNDYGLPNTTVELEAEVSYFRGEISEIEQTMIRPAKVLTGAAMPKKILEAIADLEFLGKRYSKSLEMLRRAEFKLRVVKQVEELYASK